MVGRSRKKYFMKQQSITLYNVFPGEVTKIKIKNGQGQNSPIMFVCCVKWL